MDRTVVAWLAGLWDGEGSVGITSASGPTGPYLSIGVQLEMTCERTVQRVVEVCDSLGIKARSYSYRERDPNKHLNGHYIRVNRLADALLLARAVEPYAVTKQPQWRLLIEFAESRMAGRSLDAEGRLPRGGSRLARGFSPREIEIAGEMKVLNARGPGGKKKAKEWLANLGKIKRAEASVAPPVRESLARP